MTVLALPIVRLQVQADRLKPGTAPWRVYDPAPITAVAAVRVTPHGVVGLTATGAEVLDVHNTAHPRSRDRTGTAGITVMASGDYTALRSRYGEHVIDGIAGETILVEFAAGLGRRDMPSVLTVRTGTGDTLLQGVRVADPCVEFTRFCLRRTVSDQVDDEIRDGLIHLSNGARGYRCAAASPAVFTIGDLLLIRT